MFLIHTFPFSARISFVTCALHLVMLVGFMRLGTSEYEELDIPDFARGRLFALSTTAPMAEIFNTQPQVISLSNRLLSVFRETDSILQSSLAAHRAHISSTTDQVEVCNDRDKAWLSGVRYFIRYHSWPLQKPSDCVTNLFGIPSGVTEVNSASELRQLVIKKGRELNKLASTFAKAAIKNWTNPEYPISFVYTKDSVRCEIDHLSALRIQGNWHLFSSYTNEKMTLWLPDFKRKYIREFHRVENGSLVAVRMRLPKIPEAGTAHKIVENATTVLVRWEGTAEPSSSFMRMKLEDNLALRKAFEEAERYRERAENSLTESNIAIRVLPLVLNILPLAAFAKNTAVMVVYAIVSDVVSTVPLLSEGIKLVRIDRKRFVSVVTRMGDVSSDLNTTIAAETWMAECGLEDNIGSVGTGFILVSVGMMVFGISLEIAFYWWYRRAAKPDRHRQ